MCTVANNTMEHINKTKETKIRLNVPTSYKILDHAKYHVML